MKRAPFRFIFLIVLLMGPVAHGQVITGSIVGSVRDATGAVLPGVEVTVQNENTGLSRTVVSNDEGAYRAVSLPVGPYEVRAELSGFRTIVRSGITLTVGREAVVNLVMDVGEITEELYVTGEAPLVETTRASVADLVDEKTIRELPLNGRDFVQLAMLQAGVVQSISAPRSQIGNEGIKISIAGARHSQNAVLLDGTDIRNEMNASGSASGSSLGVETVLEFQVITGVFSAEYGRFTGGVINAVSKSGTNEFHGSVFEFHRNSALDARNFFDTGESPPEFKRNQFGFTLGGPIVRDRTFFFGSYEGFRERLLSTVISFVPNGAARQGLVPRGRRGCPFGAPLVNGLCNVGVSPAIQPYLDLYPQPNGKDNGDGTADFIWAANGPTNEDYFMFKVDHQFSDADFFLVRYTLDDGDRFVQNRLPAFGEEGQYRNQWTTLEWKRIFSPSLINELRFGYNRSRHDVLPVDNSGADRSLLFVPRANRVFGEVDIQDVIATLGPSHNQYKTNVYNNFQTSDNLIYTRGRHALKFGFDWQRIQFNFLNFARASGVYEFGGLAEFLTGQPFSFDGFANDFSTIGMRQSVFGFYVQDDFSVKANLTLNFGLRYEFITEPYEVAGRLGNMETPLDPEIRLGNPYFENPSLKNFSPRIGLAWDPFGDGRTSVRAGFGIFFDQVVTNYYSSPIQQSPPNIQAVVNCTDLGDPACPSFPDAFQNLPPLDEIKPSPWVIFNPEQPYLTQWSLNLQREVFPNGVFLIGYNGSRGVHLGRFTNSNVAFGERQSDGRWFFPNSDLRNPNFATMNSTVWDANSFYHAMRLSFIKRYSNQHQFQLSYNYSRLIDDSSGTTFSDRGGSGDQIWTTYVDDHLFDRGLSGNNVSHNFTANYAVDLPGNTLPGVARHIFGGWQAGGILTAASGEQMTLLITFDQAGMGAGNVLVQRPDVVPGVDPFVGNTPEGYLNSAAFAIAPAGFLGNLGRGTITGPNRFTFDMSLVKKFQFNERTGLQFRAEFFNLLNNVNFGRMGTRVFVSPARGGIVPGSFGRFRNTVNTSRQIQFALKLSF